MHHIYHTQGFILQAMNSGESNKFITIFTRDLGLIRASAQGARFLKSKLRYSLQEFSYAEVSLVHGKSGWRITNAKQIRSLYEHFKDSSEKLELAARILFLLRRLLHGEEKNERLFLVIEHGFEFLKKQVSTIEESANFELIIVLRVLHILGYVGKVPALSIFIESPDINPAMLPEIARIRLEAISTINKSLKETQL